MSAYLTIKEAAEKTGKAEITIRRYINSIVKDNPKAAERKKIQPTEAEVKQLKKQKKPFSWQVSEDLIAQQFLKDAVKKGVQQAKKARAAADETVTQTLQNELSSKEEQLKVKDEQIKSLTNIVQSLNDRMREGNVLMASLQKHLALPEGKDGEVLEAQQPEKKTTEKKSLFKALFG